MQQAAQRSRRLLPVVAVALLVLVLFLFSRALDRGERDVPSDVGVPLTVDAHAEAAQRYSDALEEIRDASAQQISADPIGATDVYEQLLDAAENARAAFAGLPAPDGRDADHDELLDLLTGQIDALRGAVVASETRDDRALHAHLSHYADLLAAGREAAAVLSQGTDDT